MSITKRERFTLLAVRRVFDVFAKTPFLDDVQSVLAKLEQRMSAKERAGLEAFGEQFVYMPDHGTKSYEGKDEIIDAIQSGILLRKIVRYRYQGGRGEARSGHLAPFRLAMYRHGLYVIGARLKTPEGDVQASPLGVFAIERFTEAEHLKAHAFQIPEGSAVRDVLHGSFGPHLRDDDGPHDVVVEFSADKAHLVASRDAPDTGNHATVERADTASVQRAEPGSARILDPRMGPARTRGCPVGASPTNKGRAR